jgi:hypothetical protein
MRSWHLAMVLVGGALLFTARPVQAQRVWVNPGGPVVVGPTWQQPPAVWGPTPVWYGAWGSPAWGSPAWGRPPGWYRGGWYRSGWYGSVQGPRGRRVAWRRW